MDKETLKVVCYCFLGLLFVNTLIGAITKNLAILSPINVAIISFFALLAGRKNQGDKDE